MFKGFKRVSKSCFRFYVNARRHSNISQQQSCKEMHLSVKIIIQRLRCQGLRGGCEATVASVHMYMCVWHTSLHLSTSMQFLRGEKREVVVPVQLKGLWPPCQHNLFNTSGPPSLAASPFSLSASRLSPNPCLFCQLPYSCLHSVFACTHKTSLVRADEALLPTLETPGEMVNRHTSFCRQALQSYTGPEDTLESDLPLIVLLYRDDQYPCFGPGVTPPVLWHTTNTGTRLFPCSRTASICTHHCNECPSVKAPAFLILKILSEKIVASG